MKSLLSFMALSLSAWLYGGINFSQVTIKQAIDSAMAQGKKVFVVFTAEECKACAIMENTVFTDVKLGELVNREFIALKSTRRTTEGKREQYRYGISMLPTILLIDPVKGELVRFTGRKELEFLYTAINKSLLGDYSDGDPKTPYTDAMSRINPVEMKSELKVLKREEELAQKPE